MIHMRINLSDGVHTEAAGAVLEVVAEQLREYRLVPGVTRLIDVDGNDIGAMAWNPETRQIGVASHVERLL